MGIEPPNPNKKFPYLTIALIMINVVVYLVTTMVFSSVWFYLDEGNAVVNELIFYPSEFFALKDWYTLITSQFLHGDPIHIISNMYFLFVFGDDMEHCLGKPAYIIFYLFSGVIAGMFFSVFQLLLAVIASPTNLSLILDIGAVGASGALFGVMAGYGFSFPDRPLRFPGFKGTMKAKYFVLFYVGMEVVLTILGLFQGMDSVAHAAHVGGFLGGLIFTYLFKIFNNKRYAQIKNMEI